MSGWKTRKEWLFIETKMGFGQPKACAMVEERRLMKLVGIGFFDSLKNRLLQGYDMA